MMKIDIFNDGKDDYVNLNIELPVEAVTDDYQLIQAYKCEHNRDGKTLPIVRCLFKKVKIMNKEQR